MKNSMNIHASLFLLLGVFFLGATLPFISASIQYISPILFVTIRLLIACIFMMSFIHKMKRKITLKHVKYSLILGAMNSGMYILQTIGLKTIPASRAAFLVSAYIVFTPFAAYLINKSQLRITDFFVVAVSLLGMYILTGANFNSIQIGDFITLASALCFLAIIITVKKIPDEIKKNSIIILFGQLLFSLIFSSFALLITDKKHLIFTLNFTVVSSLLFCAIFASVLTVFLQLKYQRYLSELSAAIIFMLEPVFTCIFTVFINHHLPDKNEIIGGILLLLSFFITITKRSSSAVNNERHVTTKNIQ